MPLLLKKPLCIVINIFYASSFSPWKNNTRIGSTFEEESVCVIFWTEYISLYGFHCDLFAKLSFHLRSLIAKYLNDPIFCHKNFGNMQDCAILDKKNTIVQVQQSLSFKVISKENIYSNPKRLNIFCPLRSV